MKIPWRHAGSCTFRNAHEPVTLGTVSRATEPADHELVHLFSLGVGLVYIAGFDGRLKRVTRAFARTLGYTQADLQGRRFLDFIHADDLHATRQALEDLTARTNEIVRFEARFICGDGSVRCLEWLWRARRDEHVVYGVGRDVTERRMADDVLSALRRLATLVAEGVQPQNLFAVVAEEVARVMNVPLVHVVRFERDGTAITCASVSPQEPVFPVGRRWSLEGTSVARLVRTRGRPARVDDYTELEGEIAYVSRRAGIRSAVGVPIIVAGRLWGAIVVGSTELERLPAHAEVRLANFTELLATAVANAESRETLERLADEQAALRRVAELVARGVQPAQVFSAVSEEVHRLFGLYEATVGRFDHDGPAFVVVGVARNVEGMPLGSRWELNDLYVSMKVFRTGRSARVEARDLASAGGPVAARLRRLGFVSQAASPIIVEGRLWGALTVLGAEESLPPDTEDRLEKFAELVGTAIANTESQSELAASRRRIVAASDDARRRIERDLHDGTQQRLVSLGIAVRTVEARVAPDRGELRSALSQIANGLTDAVTELQEISRGIHPPILAQGGLEPALRTLARRSSVPVELDVTTPTRLPEAVEIAAYYVASEALANAAKHAQASRIELSLDPRSGSVVLSIHDDGVGGADAVHGSGLLGLADRVEALGGSLQVDSPTGAGTHITAELPLAAGTQ